MQLKQFLGSDEDRAVSPVIGVVLMLTATVIIGGVVASFVTGMGSGMESAPQASFDFDYDDTDKNVTITHEGGATIAADQLEVRVSGNNTDTIEVSDRVNDSVSTGTEIDIGDVYDDDKVRLVWESPDSDKTSQLGKWVGPDA
ncbi:Pilin/Flagellin, FlaG/FlaF family [Halanaeroarchaeum sp. HSR-CO]|uniref:type IV pilin N-terminal domain-containing protein n=1 Tax=Halanaeroarchaeum sp. HSR-CO TaxID=2866382 RepID=UPI00217DAE5B|nr:type IV pilin N-terminal domain-containing protein [Halanaeroarchaeum sp. HSR-CO]UWG46972.1 Pilin/Flagellin, FlaG/FlaF family [Halanaeroarchaeum sp. HSR-CO]